MANEITVSVNLNVTKGALNQSFNQSGLQFNMAGSKAVMNTQTIGTATAGTALSIGDIVTSDSSVPGWILIQNTDAANPITITPGSAGTAVVKLLAGEVACFRLATSTPFAVATGAPVIVQYLLVET